MMDAVSRSEGSTGFTLIEVMIALLVLAVGLISLAGLQAGGIRAGHQALVRSIAVQHAGDILDRMRANRPNALLGAYNIGLTAAYDSTGAGEPVLGDLREWKANLANDLPLGQGGLNVAGGVVTIEVRWDDNRDGVNTGDTDVLTVVTRL